MVGFFSLKKPFHLVGHHGALVSRHLVAVATDVGCGDEVGSGQQGIWFDQGSNDNLVLDNASGHNGSDGILSHGSQNHFERNVLNQNGNWGLQIWGNSTTYRGNTGQSNSGVPAACFGFPSTADICDHSGTGTSPLTDNVMPFAL